MPAYLASIFHIFRVSIEIFVVPSITTPPYLSEHLCSSSKTIRNELTPISYGMLELFNPAWGGGGGGGGAETCLLKSKLCDL